MTTTFVPYRNPETGLPHHVQPEITKIPAPESLLFVGNSLFFFNNGVHRFVRKLLAGADPKVACRTNLIAIGGASLYWHDLESYFRTDAVASYAIKNTGTASQSISLFLNNSETNTLSVGVNSPLRTYRRFTSDSQTTSYVTKTPSNVNKKNLYIATNVDDPTKYTMHTWKNVDTDPTDKELSGYIEGKSVNYDNVDYKISYVTISTEHDHAKLWLGIGDSKKWFGNDLVITAQNNTYVFKENESTAMKQSDPSAGISSFYSRAEAVVGETFDLSAKAQGTVTYTSSNIGVATIDNNGKVIANKAGKTTVTVTSTGAYGDKITAKCELTVSKEPVKSSYIPIVTNMKIEGTTDSDPVVTKVYWYIKNDTASDAEYSLGDLQISL